MARRSVVITAAWITGGCGLLAALILAISQQLAVQSNPSAVEQPFPQISRERPGLLDPAKDLEAGRYAPKEEPVRFSPLSFHEYSEKLDRLRDRNFERDVFLKELVGSRVVWKGFVAGVSSDAGVITLGLSEGLDSGGLPLAWVRFRSSWSTRLFALRNGDVVQVEAIYQGEGSVFPSLEGLNLTTEGTPTER